MRDDVIKARLANSGAESGNDHFVDFGRLVGLADIGQYQAVFKLPPDSVGNFQESTFDLKGTGLNTDLAIGFFAVLPRGVPLVDDRVAVTTEAEDKPDLLDILCPLTV